MYVTNKQVAESLDCSSTAQKMHVLKRPNISSKIVHRTELWKLEDVFKLAICNYKLQRPDFKNIRIFKTTNFIAQNMFHTTADKNCV